MKPLGDQVDRKAGGWTRALGRGRQRRPARASSARLLFALVVIASVAWASPAVAQAARADNSATGKVAVFEGVTIGAGETCNDLVVVGGDATIRGTVRNRVVVIGGDLMVGSGAEVGTAKAPDDNSVVVVFGSLSVEPGGRVTGETHIVAGGGFQWADSQAVTRVLARPGAASLTAWIWLAVAFVAVAVFFAGVAPHQVAFVRQRVRRRFFSSLGWGALAILVGGPLLTVVLVLTLLGILVIPWLWLLVGIALLLGLTVVGAALGGLILRRNDQHRGAVILEAVLGVIILSGLYWVPVAGPIILFLLAVVGFGAAYVSVLTWRRRPGRRAGSAPGSPPYEPPSSSWT